MESVAPFEGSGFPRHSLAVVVLSLVHLVHVLGLVCVGCHQLAVCRCGGPYGCRSRGWLTVPPVTGRTMLLIEPRVVPCGLVPAGFCVGRLSLTAVWCACAPCLGL